jgi:ribosomal protein S18 acetylase RimI-like enzyme
VTAADLVVRAAAAADADAMGECMVRSWIDAHAGQIPDELLERRRRDWKAADSAAGWRRTLTEIDQMPGHPSSVRVAELAGEIVGIGMVSLHDHAADIDALYVVPDRRSRGVGRALVGALAEVAARDDAHVVDVTVLGANAPARGFYEHLGAVPVADGVFDEDGTLLPTVTYRWTSRSLRSLRSPVGEAVR